VALFARYVAVKTPIDDTRHSPCNQSGDTREWQPSRQDGPYKHMGGANATIHKAVWIQTHGNATAVGLAPLFTHVILPVHTTRFN
jgi:hypothetical protein